MNVYHSIESEVVLMFKILILQSLYNLSDEMQPSVSIAQKTGS